MVFIRKPSQSLPQPENGLGTSVEEALAQLAKNPEHQQVVDAVRKLTSGQMPESTARENTFSGDPLSRNNLTTALGCLTALTALKNAPNKDVSGPATIVWDEVLGKMSSPSRQTSSTPAKPEKTR